MELKKLLKIQSKEILDSALQSLNCAYLKSYDKSTEAENHKRLFTLLALPQQCITEKKLLPMREYAAQIANERFDMPVSICTKFTQHLMPSKKSSGTVLQKTLNRKVWAKL